MQEMERIAITRRWGRFVIRYRTFGEEPDSKPETRRITVRNGEVAQVITP